MTGFGEWLVLAAVIVVVVSFRKLPQLPGSLAESVRGFRKGLRGERTLRDVTPPRSDAP